MFDIEYSKEKEEDTVNLSFRVRKDLYDRLQEIAKTQKTQMPHPAYYLLGMLYAHDIFNTDKELAIDTLIAIRYSKNNKNREMIDKLLKATIKKSVKKK